MRTGTGVRWLAGLTIATTACGGAEVPSAGADTGSGGSADAVAQDAPAGNADVGGPGGVIVSVPLTTAIHPKINGETKQETLAGMIYKPQACSADHQCPLVVVVGDYDSNAWPNYGSGAKGLAGQTGAVVAIFNLPGTGSGGSKSGGEDDIGGVWHYTAVAEVMHQLASRSEIDKTRTGFVSVGAGLISVAAAFKIFGNGSLKDVAFLIDVEGPIDRCAISQAPEDLSKGIGPSDGPGATESACHYGLVPHSEQYPAAKDGAPASIVCAEGAWPITLTGKDCQSGNSWWVERDAYSSLKSLTQRYWRLQFQYDHRLPSHASSTLALKALASSPSKMFRYNDLAACTVPSANLCKQRRDAGFDCALQGDFGNGMAPAPYAAGKLQPVSAEALLSQVLPYYVTTVMDQKALPNCK